MWATVVLAESLERMAQQGPLTITISVGDSSSVTMMPPWEATYLAGQIRKDVTNLQRRYVRKMVARRARMATGKTVSAGLITDTHTVHADMLAWLADDGASIVEVLGVWAMEQEPFIRLMACRAVAEGDTATLDHIDPRWRQGHSDDG